MELKLIVSCVLIYGAVSAILFVYRRFIARSPLDNIPGPPRSTLLKGNISEFMNLKAWGFHKELAQRYGSIATVNGLLGERMLYVVDPLAMHHILIKDVSYYQRIAGPLLRLIFGNGLLSVTGDVHRRQRKMLNPVFSAAHMREMVPVFFGIGQKLEKAFDQRVKNGPHEIDVLTWSTRTALELIAQSGFGTTFDPLTEDALPHPYAHAAKEMVIFLAKNNIARMYLSRIVTKIGSPKFRRRVLEWLPFKSYQEGRQHADMLYNTAVEIYEAKKRALAQGDEAFKDHIAQGKDLISILMRENRSAESGDKLSDDEILGQMSTFTFAATDTTSTAISRTLWMLSQYQDVQDKVRAELCEVMGDRNTLTYDELDKLKYLDAVCRELMRLHPPIATMVRGSTEDMILPLHTPVEGVDGHVMTEIVVPKNTKIFMSLLNCNRNPALWGPDAEEFKPERWLDQLPDTVTSARIPGVYANLMTFSGGSFGCIGFKFSQLEMKVILTLLLRKFKFSLPKDKEIYWNMSGIASPCVIGPDGPSSPQLPLIVEEAK